MLYSKSKSGFYDRELHGTAIPSDAIEITEADHAALLAGQAAGQCIAASKDGRPVLSDPPAPTPEQLASSARSKRDVLIAETDYLAMPDYPATPAELAAVKAYRQALRDVPAQSGFPATISWPVQP